MLYGLLLKSLKSWFNLTRKMAFKLAKNCLRIGYTGNLSNYQGNYRLNDLKVNTVFDTVISCASQTRSRNGFHVFLFTPVIITYK